MSPVKIVPKILLLAVLSVGCAQVDPSPANSNPGNNRNNANNINNANNANNQNNANNANNVNNANNSNNTNGETQTDGVPFPYVLPDVPAGATAPWPGGIVNGALIEVEHVIDGDTVFLRTGEGEFDLESIRVQGINAPECKKRRGANGLNECDPNNDDFSGDPEYWGYEAKVALEEFAEGKTVRLACKEVGGQCETDRYDRFLGVLIVDGEDASEFLASGGHAWSYTQFPVENLHTYCTAEEDAIDREAGMWEAGFDTVILGMNTSTRNWYTFHDQTCADYAP